MTGQTGGRHVVILMGLLNGGRWIDTQLASIAAQDHQDWSLLVGDDGSSDDGPARIRDFARAHPGHDVALMPGPGGGFARNFLSLIEASATTPRATLALSDQDDEWLPERLSRGLAALDAEGSGPTLYCGRTIVCTNDLRALHVSPLWSRPFSLQNALVQNVASGNTIMMNPEMAALARAAAPQAAAAGIVAHDWWLYQLATACGARVVQDSQPVLRYRQHAGNTMGRNDTARARLARIRQIHNGTFARWIDANRTALAGASPRLHPAAHDLLIAFHALRHPASHGRLTGLRQTGLYRQTQMGDRALWWATTIGRL